MELESFWCDYRGPGGLKCAAGHWIRDDKYDPKMEDLAISQVHAEFGEEVFCLEGLSFLKAQRVLRDLQMNHDIAAKHTVESPGAFAPLFLERAVRTGISHALDTTVAEELYAACSSETTKSG